MKRKLANKMNYLGCKIDIVKSLAKVLNETVERNDDVSKKDSKNLIILLQNRIKDIKFRYEEIVSELHI
ncbi:hypothetical protein IJ707_05950 [bacterium]|nr:hypothetical protein [bacterium]